MSLQGNPARFWTLFICVLALTFALGAGVPARAQEPDGDTWGAAERQAYFERMEADIQRSQAGPDLPRMGFTPCTGGTAGGFKCKKVDLLAYLPHNSIGGGTGNDVWGWTDPLNGSEYAIVGQSNGTAFINVTDPVNPIYLGRLPSHTSTSIWRDIKVYKNRAFIVSEASGHGLQVFDLRRLRNVPAPPQVFTEDAHYGGFGSAHNIAVNEASGFAYVVGAGTCGGGLTILNISSPNNPFSAGCFSADGYTHDAQCVIYTGPDTTYQGDEICFAYNEDTLTIVNVTNKSAPYMIARKSYSGARYTHQGWITDNQKYLLLDDEQDETTFGHNTRTRIWNISNLDNPTVMGFFDGPNASTDHNLYISNGYAYEANYSSGLQILDLAGISGANLALTGYFDTYPANNNTGISGAWSTYPFFDSGNVLVNSIGEGLFILRPAYLPDYSLAADANSLSACLYGTVGTTVRLNGLNGYSGTVQLSAAGLPAPAGVQFTPASVIIPGSSAMTVTVNTLSAGSYPVTVTGTDGSLQHSASVTLKVFNSPPGAFNPASPGYGETGVSTAPVLTWTAAGGATSYFVEIATDAAFDHIVDSGFSSGTSYSPAAPLNMLSKYFWRVTAWNPCGSGPVSNLSYFVTEMLVCRAPTLPIPDNQPSGAEDFLTISETAALADLDLSIEVDHSWVGDLKVKLTHEDTGTTVTALDRPGVPASPYGCSGDNIDAVLDDEAASPVENACGSGTPTIAGSYIPNNPLAGFDGESAAGSWKLVVSDLSMNDTGTLIRWCIGADVDLPPEADIYLQPLDIFSAQVQGMMTSRFLTIANTGTSDLEWTVAETTGECGTPGDVAWLSVSPGVGTTSPAQFSSLAVSFNTAGLPEGIYTAGLCVSSNDPDESLVSIPVVLQVVLPLYDVFVPFLSNSP